MASGSLSVGGIAIIANLLVPDEAGESGIVPVTSPLAEIEGATVLSGMATEAILSLLPDAALLRDCRPIGVGDVIEGNVWAGIGGPAFLLGGEAGDEASPELSTAGTPDGPPVLSNVIAILNVPSTITTTLAPTSKGRIFEGMVDGALD